MERVASPLHHDTEACKHPAKTDTQTTCMHTLNSSDNIQEKEDGRHKIREETMHNIKRKTMAVISVMGLITTKFDATA